MIVMVWMYPAKIISKKYFSIFKLISLSITWTSYSSLSRLKPRLEFCLETPFCRISRLPWKWGCSSPLLQGLWLVSCSKSTTLIGQWSGSIGPTWSSLGIGRIWQLATSPSDCNNSVKKQIFLNFFKWMGPWIWTLNNLMKNICQKWHAFLMSCEKAIFSIIN